jgi:hypothetical protein
MLLTNLEGNGLPRTAILEQPVVEAEGLDTTTTGTSQTVSQQTFQTKPRLFGQSDIRTTATQKYKDWHLSVGNAWAYDCDLIEARKPRRPDGTYGNGLKPAMMSELTSVEPKYIADERYLKSILNKRLLHQREFLAEIAKRTGVPFVVIFISRDNKMVNVWVAEENVFLEIKKAVAK